MRVFIPSDENDLVVPFIEDARSDFAPFYAVTKGIKAIEGEVLAELAKDTSRDCTHAQPTICHSWASVAVGVKWWIQATNCL